MFHMPLAGPQSSQACLIVVDIANAPAFAKALAQSSFRAAQLLQRVQQGLGGVTRHSLSDFVFVGWSALALSSFRAGFDSLRALPD